jgi:hypothetical protein
VHYLESGLSAYPAVGILPGAARDIKVDFVPRLFECHVDRHSTVKYSVHVDLWGTLL